MFNRNEESDDTEKVSQTKTNVQSKGLINKKTSFIPEKKLNPQNKTFGISDISVQASEESKNLDQSSKSIDIVHSSVEDSHIVNSYQLDKKKLISEEAKIS